MKQKHLKFKLYKGRALVIVYTGAFLTSNSNKVQINKYYSWRALMWCLWHIKFEASKVWKLWIGMRYLSKYLTYIMMMLHTKKDCNYPSKKNLYLKVLFSNFSNWLFSQYMRCSHLRTTLCFGNIQEVRVRMLRRTLFITLP